MNTPATLTPRQFFALVATPTGHALEAHGPAALLAERLDIPPQAAAATLGALRRAGLVTLDSEGRGDGVATWARFDSFAPGLEAAQVVALEAAEHESPCRAQAEALDSFGPDCEAAPNGIAPRPDLGHDVARARSTRTPAARPEGREALPRPGDILGNGSTVLEVRASDLRAYVLAFTGKGRAHPFAVWRLEVLTRDSAQVPPSWGTYSGDYFATLGRALEGLATRAGDSCKLEA